MEDGVTTALRHFEEGAVWIAHQAQVARVQSVQCATGVGPVQLVSLAVEVDRVLLDRVLTRRARRAAAGAAAGGGDQAQHQERRNDDLETLEIHESSLS